MGEHGDELVGGRVARPPRGRGGRSLRLGRDAIDPAPVAPAIQLGRVVMMVGHSPLGVLDELTIVVHEVQRPVGSRGEVHGTEPGVGRGQELPPLLRAPRHERGPERRPHVAVHEVLRRLRHER